MSVKQLLEALDNQIISGDILGAFDQFFADDCVTLSSASDKTSGKAQKRQGLQWFFDGMIRTNRIERLNARVDGDTTLSEFVFDFTDRVGKNQIWHEVIRRVWRNEQVVEETYFLDLANENPFHKVAMEKTEPAQSAKSKPKVIAEPTQPAKSKTKSPVEPAQPAKAKSKVKGTPEPASDKKSATRSSKKATA